MDKIWNVVTWSLLFLYLGIWPLVDHEGSAWPDGSPEAVLAGTLLAGGYRGVLWLLKGDFDHFAKNMKCQSYRANLMCEWCPCNQGSYPNITRFLNYPIPELELICNAFQLQS